MHSDRATLAGARRPALHLRPVPEPQATPTGRTLPDRSGERLVGSDEVVHELRPREPEADCDLSGIHEEIDIHLAAHLLTVTTSSDPLPPTTVKVYSGRL